ncbi:MAG TPA: bacteriophage abortive infection AbiH family protein [Nitrosomonas mobilis]|nr:bacteriophage abortive infection AbiH family protein [Nitrosomonas mobilis]
MQAPSSLYVIGNGFDLHHGLATGFFDFKQYVLDKQPDIKDVMEKYLYGLDGNWCNLEEALACFDADALIGHANNFLVDYGADDWSDSYHHDYQYVIEQVVKAISTDLKDQFYSWLQEIEIPNSKARLPPLLDINRSGKFLSFNYTPTLQDLYGVEPSEIVHIHGVLFDDIKDVILGHGWDLGDRPNLNQGQDPKSVDTRVMEGNRLIDEYFQGTFKPTQKLINQHRQFFSSLAGVSEIYVWGHSLSSVDLPYFVEIAKWTEQSKPNWHISHHCSSSILHNEAAIVGLGVSSSKIEHHKLDQYW